MTENTLSVFRARKIYLLASTDKTEREYFANKISEISNVEIVETGTNWIKIKYKFPETCINDIEQKICDESEISISGGIYHRLINFMEQNERDIQQNPKFWQNYIQPIYSNLHSRDLKLTKDSYKKQWQNYKKE